MGHMDHDVYLKILKGLAEEEYIDSIITLGCVGSSAFISRTMGRALKYSEHITPETADTVSKEMVKREGQFLSEVNNIVRQTNKPIVAVTLRYSPGSDFKEKGKDVAVVYSTPEKAVKAIEKLYEYSQIHR